MLTLYFLASIVQVILRSYGQTYGHYQIDYANDPDQEYKYKYSPIFLNISSLFSSPFVTNVFKNNINFYNGFANILFLRIEF